jgi:hypothetical protein
MLFFRKFWLEILEYSKSHEARSWAKYQVEIPILMMDPSIDYLIDKSVFII